MSTPFRVTRTARVTAQGKINLFLRILSREPSGYHQLETLFQRIALADAVTVRTGVEGRSLDCRGADTGPAANNLAWRAAVAFAEAAGGPATFAIEIEKRIPVGGGLGGGSADAAAVLRALNALSAKPLDEKTLAAIAFALGADVPYLLSPHALAIGAGRGERLVPLSPLPARDVLLAVPSFGVSSADAFGWYAEQKGARRPGTRATLAIGRALEWKTIAALAANDPGGGGGGAPSGNRCAARCASARGSDDRADERRGINGVRRVRRLAFALGGRRHRAGDRDIHCRQSRSR